jgi:ubiquinone/menaquinone biosynthesis C-methylase UbiE
MDDEALATKRQWGQIFDRAEPTYDQFASSYFSHFGPSLVKRAAPVAGSKVLDVACGKGAVLLAAMEQMGGAGLGLGVDISPGMARSLQRLARERKFPNVSSAVMDAENLGVADAAVDVVLSAFSLHFLPEPERTAAEFRRVLRPGGTLGISEWGDGDPRWAWEGDLLAAAGSAGPYVARHFEKVDDVKILLEGAGFSSLDADSEEWTVHFADVDEWWAWKWSFGFRRHLDAMSEEGRRRFKHAAEEAMRPLATSQGYPMTLHANFVVGRAGHG